VASSLERQAGGFMVSIRFSPKGQADSAAGNAEGQIFHDVSRQKPAIEKAHADAKPL
jgi:hypothetical protein